MNRFDRPAVTRLAAILVTLSLAAVAAALVVTAMDERAIADAFRRFPDVAKEHDGKAFAALVEALVALATSIAALLLGGRLRFALSGLLSLLTLGTGIWIAVARVPYDQFAGPVLRSEPLGLALAIASASCLAASAVGWLSAPDQDRPPRPHMPPPTHQA